MAISTLIRCSRIAACALAFAGLVMLSGCFVYSVQPLYEEALLSHPDPDLSFDQDLVGSWWQPREGCLLTITSSEQTYRVEYVTPAKKQGAGCAVDEGQTIRLEGRLVKLDQHRFLDLVPRESDLCFQCLPLHAIYLVSQEKDSLSLKPINYKWLKAALAEKKVSATFFEKDFLTLTVPPKDLKDPVRKYADDPVAFKSMPGPAFKRK